MTIEEVLEYFNEGERLRSEGHIDEAVSSYNTALNLDNEKKYSAPVRFRIALIEVERGNVANAITGLRESVNDINSLNGSVRAKNQLSQMSYFNLGLLILDRIIKGNTDYDIEESEKCLERAIEIEIENCEELKGLREDASEKLETVRKIKENGLFYYDERGGITGFYSKRS
jgi:tetratricopeptide (TPR) repeat protein